MCEETLDYRGLNVLFGSGIVVGVRRRPMSTVRCKGRNRVIAQGACESVDSP